MAVCTNCGRLSLSESARPLMGSDVQDFSPALLRARVADIQSEILRYKSYIQDLEAEQSQLESQLALVVYPVLTLPHDITSTIFIHCLHAHGRVRPSPKEAPLLLAQICRTWREVALSTGKLWSSVDLKFEWVRHERKFGDIPKPGALPLLQTWLSRTRGCLVSLTLRSTHRQFSPDILSLILSFAPQLRRLELILRPGDFHYLRAASPTFPALRDLAVLSWGREPTEDLIPVFGNPLALRKLRLLFHPYSAASIGQHTFLTTLELQTTSVPIILDVLPNCPQLLHLKVRLTIPTPELLVAPLTLGLHSLDLTEDTGPDPSVPLLNYLTLTELRRLDINHEPELGVLPSFLTRSACALDHLGLRVASDADDKDDEAKERDRARRRELDHILRMFPSLSSLHVHAGANLTHVVYILRASASGVVVPRLKNLTLSTWDAMVNGHHYLLSFLVNRRSSVGGNPVLLESFRLNLCGDAEGIQSPWAWPSRSDLFEFKELLMGGLDVRISSKDNQWPEPRHIDPCEEFPDQSEYPPV